MHISQHSQLCVPRLNHALSLNNPSITSVGTSLKYNIMEKILSSKGKTLIVLNNFKYRLDKRLKSSEDRWRCSEKTCGSVLFTCEDGNVISRVVKEHNHEPCAEKALDRQRVNSAVKKKVVENMNAELIHREIAEQEASVSSLTKQDIMTLIRKSVRKTQQKALPKLPESSAEVSLSTTVRKCPCHTELVYLLSE